MIIGNFMLLNLFLAILLKYIEEKDEEDEKNQESDEIIPGQQNDKNLKKDNL